MCEKSGNNKSICIGQVTEEEKKEILALYERLGSLEELTMIIEETSELYPKMVAETQLTQDEFNSWWNRMDDKYQWSKSRGCCSLRIDFETRQIWVN